MQEQGGSQGRVGTRSQHGGGLQRRECESRIPGWPIPSQEASLHPRLTDFSRGSGPWPDCSPGTPSSADLPVLTHPGLGAVPLPLFPQAPFGDFLG